MREERAGALCVKGQGLKASTDCLRLRARQPSQKTFKIKRVLAKKAKQNRPIPQWIRFRTNNKIRRAAAQAEGLGRGQRAELRAQASAGVLALRSSLRKLAWRLHWLRCCRVQAPRKCRL